eukprot:6187507-Pleurochrysis_carterae.AAC.1
MALGLEAIHQESARSERHTKRRAREPRIARKECLRAKEDARTEHPPRTRLPLSRARRDWSTIRLPFVVTVAVTVSVGPRLHRQVRARACERGWCVRRKSTECEWVSASNECMCAWPYGCA